MTLISLLLVLALERATQKSQYWQWEFYVARYQHFLQARGLLKEDASFIQLLATVLLPSLLVFVLLQQLDAFLLELILDCALLMVCIGCVEFRQSYRGYLQAASRGDIEASHLYAEQLGYPCDSGNSFGQCLVWINYRHYMAVSIWFIVFGGAGAMFYVLSRAMLGYLKQQQWSQLTGWQKLMEGLDWLPARLGTLGLLVVGHFSRALPVWLGHLFNPSSQARTLTTEVAKAAEYIEPDTLTCSDEPCTMVRLVKRNMMLLLVIVAVLTLAGIVG
ncbi:beta-lactamase regulator AmpE [Bowmanella denitrificans]|uniref:Beta-lactamase regulator AmpE n=1 Tax=Bowmanella denitrificans TaxID=366582 RepID=A0ABP3GW08_9ALTE